MEMKNPQPVEVTRRELMKRAAYSTPAILTLAAIPAFAGKGSDRGRKVRKRPQTEK